MRQRLTANGSLLSPAGRSPVASKRSVSHSVPLHKIPLSRPLEPLEKPLALALLINTTTLGKQAINGIFLAFTQAKKHTCCILLHLKIRTIVKIEEVGVLVGFPGVFRGEGAGCQIKSMSKPWLSKQIENDRIKPPLLTVSDISSGTYYGTRIRLESANPVQATKTFSQSCRIADRCHVLPFTVEQRLGW